MIVPMKRLTLIALRSDEEAVMRSLQALGAVELIASGERESEELARLSSEAERVLGARKAIKPYYKKSALAPTPECSEAELEAGRAASGALCAEIEALSRRLAEKRAEADKARALSLALEPFAGIDTPIEEIKSTRSARFIVGTADERGLAAVRELPEALDAPHIAVEEFPFEGGTALIIGCYRLYYEAVQRALKDISFVEYNFPPLKGTVSENIARLGAEAAAADGECAEAEAGLAQKAAERAELEKAADALEISLARETGICSLALTECAFIVDGWVRADKLRELDDAVAAVTDAYYIDLRDPADDETPPSLMKNGPLVEPYESITSMYAAPSYRGVDATPALAPFYFLFFGMMLSDSGYGLVLLVGGLLFLKLLKPRAGMAKLVKVIAMGGLSALICGPFIGTFFGMEWNDIFHTDIFPLLFDPMVDVLPMMLLSCGLGLIHMFTGIIIKMYMCFRDGDPQSAIFDQLSWMLLLIGLIGIFAAPEGALKTASLVLTALGGGMLFLFSGRPSKNPIKRVTKGLGALYNITGYLSDILSYVRIFALGLVSGAMGMVFNLIGGMIYTAFSGLGIPGMVIGFIFAGGVLLVLHVFSLFINTLGAYAHTARLQFIEFFGKFYEADGIAFKPFAAETKNCTVRGE